MIIAVNILHNLALADYSTMHLGGPVAHVAEIHNRQELEAALDWAKEQNLPTLMIGGGSNIIWRDEGFNGLLLINKVFGYQDFAEDETNHYLTIGAGEIWDSVVERSVVAGLTGIEALSLIPGSAGATPIQNVGAYGQEVSQTLVSVEVYDTQASDFITLPGFECDLTYRNSRFKTGPDRGRFFIMSLTLHLMKGNPFGPFYPAVQQYFDSNGVNDITPAKLREAVVNIRRAKLPDPAIINNCGSFFANPIIDKGTLVQIEADFGAAPNWKMDEGRFKISAAWLLEKAGFKDFHDDGTGMATWPTQPLVFINEKARSAADLLTFKQKIVADIEAKFHVTLIQELELLP